MCLGYTFMAHEFTSIINLTLPIAHFVKYSKTTSFALKASVNKQKKSKKSYRVKIKITSEVF